ncbi:DUF6932 family protein [Roseiconus lacunae]|uniref:Polymerase nucleotidyl transferase domain-containing protein n=1 Tax=Roseiconus lacunae TaxID=2605694 RepID=A0ABT7PEP3_9BACT|nr:hypothetical protein [Roseiconus lacunae]MDM4014962.1 hypothetical protein [Roseiconus lacunae]
MGVPSDKPEFPPLLPEGQHSFTLSELERKCVHAFKESATREKIFDGVCHLIDKLSSAGLSGDFWLDGSFLTKKIDPADADIVLVIDHVQLDDATEEQILILDWFGDPGRKLDLLCDNYIALWYPSDHDRFEHGQTQLTYWNNWWGTARNGEKKGFAVLNVSTGGDK